MIYNKQNPPKDSLQIHKDTNIKYIDDLACAYEQANLHIVQQELRAYDVSFFPIIITTFLPLSSVSAPLLSPLFALPLQVSPRPHSTLSRAQPTKNGIWVEGFKKWGWGSDGLPSCLAVYLPCLLVSLSALLYNYPFE